MQVTKDNYYKVVNELGVENLSPALKSGHELISRATKQGTDWKAYTTFQKVFDDTFYVLGKYYDELKNQAKPSAEKSSPKVYPVIKQEPKGKVTKHKAHKDRKPVSQKKGNGDKGDHNRVPKFEKPKVKGKGVELISPEVNFIKRFALLHSKEKTLDQVGSFIRSLQKAIVERKIRKTSKYSKVIMDIQARLIKKYRTGAEKIHFNHDKADLDKFFKIAGAEVVMPTIRFIKAFVSLSGKEITKHKAKNLLNRIKKNISKKVITPANRYYKQIKMVIASLEEFLNQHSRKTLSIREAQLNGLEGVLHSCGCQSHQPIHTFKKKEEQEPEVDDGVMTVEEARKQEFRPVPLTEPWLGLIGKMCLPTQFLVYGMGGSGKTSFVLLFTQFLASLGYKILYVAREQYGTPTITEILNRLNIVVGDNFKIVKDLHVLDPKDFDFVVLDSKDEMDVSLPLFKEIKAKYPEQSFIMISQANKDGSFTGTGKWRNAVDVMVYADKGKIRTGMDKNRWGGTGEMRVL